MNVDEFLWCEKYRPSIIDDCILPNSLKDKFKKVIESGNLVNFLFHGSPGTGKTTVAKALCEEMGLDYIVINGSKEGRLIETVRNTVTHFATTWSIFSNKPNSVKVVIYDEFDNSGDVQMAIRGLMEEVSQSTRFIFTGNYVSRIIEPIQSRVSLVEFSIPKNEEQIMMSRMFMKCSDILKAEGIQFEPAAVVALIRILYPDFRRVLNELQSYSVIGKIDTGIVEASRSKYEVLVDYILDRDFTMCRKWVYGNGFDGNIYSKMVDIANSKGVDKTNLISFIHEANKYQCQHPNVPDPFLNLLDFCVTIMEVL